MRKIQYLGFVMLLKVRAARYHSNFPAIWNFKNATTMVIHASGHAGPFSPSFAWNVVKICLLDLKSTSWPSSSLDQGCIIDLGNTVAISGKILKSYMNFP